MRCRLLGAGLLLTTFVFLPVLDVHAQKKKKGDDQPEAGPIDSAKLSGREYVGILKSVPGTDRFFLLEVEVPGAGGAGARNSGARALQQAQLQLARARTPQARMQAMRSLQRAMLSGNRGNAGWGKNNTQRLEIEFQVSEKVKVRTKIAREQFDEKGNVKQLSARERAALASRDGAESSIDRLETGQIVRVVVGPAAVRAAKGKDDDEEKKVDKKVQVRMIVVLGESQGEAPRARGKKKK